MPPTRRPQRLLAALAVAGIAVGGVLAMPGNAQADGPTWRDGWCRDGEGQTVVIDWRETPDAVPDVEEPQLVRCILMAPDNRELYPVEGDMPIADPLASAEIPYGLDRDGKGFITSVNGVDAPSDLSWHWSTGQADPAEGEDYWLGQSDFSPQPEIDFVGITLTSNPDDPLVSLPLEVPKFDTSEPTPTPTDTVSPSPTPTPTPTETTTGPGEGGPTGTATPTSTPTTSPTRTPTEAASSTRPPTQTATSTPTATRSTASPAPTMSATSASTTSRPSRTQRPTRPNYRPQRPTYQPQRPDYGRQQPSNPPIPPLDDGFPPMDDAFPPVPAEEFTEEAPPEDVTGQATAVANPTPSIVWGREDVTRESAESSSRDDPAPWSQLAALAGAVVVVGGLGTAFARGLQTSQPPVVEEE